MKKILFILFFALMVNSISAQGVTKNGSVVTDATVSTLKVGTVVYPNTDGTANQVLITDGAGTATWAASPAAGVPYTGATAPVDLGAYDLKINGTIFGTNGHLGNVDIGIDAGMDDQGDNSIALGSYAGKTSQGNSAIAVGESTGYEYQGSNAIAIGSNAGFYNQGSNAIAIGSNAGQNSQGSNTIAIGSNVGQTNQAQNSIILNASGNGLDSNSSGFFVSPISASSDPHLSMLTYDTITSEISINSAKTFVINHPTKPDSYLVHACLEGPEAGVYYRGEAKINNNQSVTVKLPEYVSAFAANFSIQITAIYEDDSDESLVFSTSRVKDNSFTVRGKNGSFYWIVYGQRGKVEVEPKKAAVEVGGDGPYKYIKSKNK
jgi:hypothetical protein